MSKDSPGPDFSGGSEGVQVGNDNTQNNYYFGGQARLGGADALRGAPAGRPLAEVSDPFDLEVHRPVRPDGPQPALPQLPAYVPRGHDQELAAAVRAAAGGASGIAVLVAGSSTGKTRACWEALRILREQPEQWRLWHPIDPSRPDAALRELPQIGPRTVVWLNEAQFYLDAPGGAGERVAAGLRELLRDPGRAPVLILATLWPTFWHALTDRPLDGDDPHAQARDLLGAGRSIQVPAAFTAAELKIAAAAGDPRLARAAGACEDGQVIQFLAGAPQLMDRYLHAPPAAAALIDAAIDARRLGAGIALPLTFLEEAASGYLTDAEWDALGEDWLEQALAYAAAPCSGVRGPLTRIRPRPSRNDAPALRAARRPGGYRGQHRRLSGAGEAVYRLADYLDQHGRRSRRSEIPPQDFWSAAAALAGPGDLNAVAEAASRRGLLHEAARLRKLAAAAGNDFAAASLVKSLSSLHPCDEAPADWAVRHASLVNPLASALLLDALREAGAARQVMTLADRAAAGIPVDDTYGVRRLLVALRDAGADQQAAALAARAPWQASPEQLSETARLEGALPATDLNASFLPPDLEDPVALGAQYDRWMVRGVLDALWAATRGQQGAILGDRAVAHPAPGCRSAAGFLLAVLQQAHFGNKTIQPTGSEASAVLVFLIVEEDGHSQPVMLVDIDNAPLPPGLARSAVSRLYARASVGARLATSDAGHLVAVPGGSIRKSTGWDSLIIPDFGRNPPPVSSADAQVVALLERAVSHAALDEPSDVAFLLEALREARADQGAEILLSREPAAHVALDNAYSVARLLDALREAGAHQQADILLSREPAAHVPLDNAYGVARLLDALREAGAHQQADILLSREPAAHVPLGSSYGVARLLDALREAGAGQQAAVIGDRLPREGLFSLFLEQGDNQPLYRFGRELDGSPASAWYWEDLTKPPGRA